MCGKPRLLLAAFMLNLVAGAALGAEVIIANDTPAHSQPRFFERVQGGKLTDAIAKRGQVVNVAPGDYYLRVPCDSIVPGSFSDVKVSIDEKSLTRLRLTECGVEMNLQDAATTREAARLLQEK